MKGRDKTRGHSGTAAQALPRGTGAAAGSNAGQIRVCPTLLLFLRGAAAGSSREAGTAPNAGAGGLSPAVSF